MNREAEMTASTERDRRLLILEDDHALAVGWANMLGATPSEVRIASSIASARAVLRQEPRLDGALLDYRLPDGDCTELLYELQRREPCPGIAIVTGHCSNALRLAVHPITVLVKPLSSADLRALVETLMVRDDAAERALAEFADAYALSARHRQLLRCAVRGLSHEQAASELGCGLGTVKEHWRRIFRKVGLLEDGDGLRLQQRVLGFLVGFGARRPAQRGPPT